MVVDAFAIRDRGLVLQPSLPVDAFESGAALVVHLTGPDGIRRQAEGRFMLEHLNLGAKGSKWEGVIVLDDLTEHVPAGTVVVARPKGP